MKEAIYGFPCVENPHDFTPDEESCTPAEIAFWEDAKKAMGLWRTRCAWCSL
jgi:hypothetical protein